MTRRVRLLFAVIAALAILPLVGILGVTTPAQAAASIDYPTWDQVKAAQANEAAAKAQVAAITALLTQLQAEVDATQADAEAKGQIYNDAETAFENQDYITQQLQAQADAAQAKADAAKKLAGALLAQLSKSGSGDLTTSLLANSSSADSLLYKLGAMSKLSQRSEAVYTEAIQLQNAAGALTDQANVAKAKLAELKQTAEAAFQVAQAAATAAADKLAEQQAHQAQLQAQLAVLTQKRAATEADYNAGIKAMWGDNAGGQISAQGWARPSNGHLGDKFGMRFHPIYHYWKLHSGQDISGQGCGATIYAAHSGTVIYAGPNGDLGNFIKIDHGDGTATGYGHIMPGGIHVRIGQHVDPGQPIAQVGNTGGSTGCHLHFMTWINGSLTDPIPFMRDRGVTLG